MHSVPNVTPWQTAGRPGWNATFRDAAGQRVTRSLKTRDRAEADLLCRALGILAHHRPASPRAAPTGMPPRALELYFGVQLGPAGFDVPHPIDPDAVATVVDANASHERLLIRVAEVEIARQQAVADAAAARHRIGELESELGSLKASALGRAAEGVRRCPKMAEALELYRAHLAVTSSAQNAQDMAHVADIFINQLSSDVRTPAHVTPEHVATFLDAEATKVRDGGSPSLRRQRRRVRVGRFLNWAAKTWGYPSPMPAVRGATIHQIARQRDDIHWHELSEVEAALKPLDTYWKALVGTLAFAGLRLSELIWLRRSDLELPTDGRAQLWVATVDDGHGQRHELKTGHSRRAVEVHRTRLLPLIENHLAAGNAGDLFLFPVPTAMRGQTRKTGNPERWVVGSLSRVLSGAVKPPGTKRKRKRTRIAPILPSGMSARSLRRTFGSLLLRDGATIESVAAVLGNTSSVVRMHYARILGSEVSVKF